MSSQSIKSVRADGKASASYRAVLMAGVAVLAMSAVHAQAEPTQATVKYEDLDLSQPAAAKALYTRLQAAARRVCASNDVRNVSMRRLENMCYREALARAVDEIGHASVKALYATDDSIRLAARRSESRTRT
jgi:UrcA family protein